jgi:hypothetical protein
VGPCSKLIPKFAATVQVFYLAKNNAKFPLCQIRKKQQHVGSASIYSVANGHAISAASTFRQAGLVHVFHLGLFLYSFRNHEKISPHLFDFHSELSSDCPQNSSKAPLRAVHSITEVPSPNKLGRSGTSSKRGAHGGI